MRRLVGRSTAKLATAKLAMAAVAATGIIQPAFASDLSVGIVDLASVVPASAGNGGTTHAGADLARFGIATIGSPAAQADYRLHPLVATLPAQPSLPLDSQTARLRRGFGGAMADFYPLGIDGFHVSGGSRFYSRGPARAGVVDARGLVDMRYVTLLYSPRSMLARASRRMTPALTLGYTKLIQGGMSLGIEGGAMLGKFDTLAGSLARPPRLRGDGLSDGANRLSQVARMTFGYHF